MTAVPILPSLQQEAKKGWDAMLPIRGVPNYYQFKLSDYLIGANAKYRKNKPFYPSPYFRISLHRRYNNQQHQRLRELSKTAPDTYYVAPETNDVNEFNSHFLGSRVIEISRMIPVNECKDIFDDEQHFITYQRGKPKWHEHSEPILHESSILGSEHESFLHSQRERVRLLDLVYARELWETNAALADKVLAMERYLPVDEKRILIAKPKNRTRNAYLEAAAGIAMTLFRSVLVFVGESKSDKESRSNG